MQQQRYSPIVKDAAAGRRASTARACSSSPSILVTAIVVNVVVNVSFNGAVRPLPVHRRRGLGRAAAVRAAAPARTGASCRARCSGAIFLLSLVLAASMMPVHKLPDASWHVALGLGFVSAVFDNIPLTALALKQGGYDWGFVAYAVGFGGSMIWFGSSAGVALTNLFPEGKIGRSRGCAAAGTSRSRTSIGFFVMLVVHPWVPDTAHKVSPVPVASMVRAT